MKMETEVEYDYDYYEDYYAQYYAQLNKTNLTLLIQDEPEVPLEEVLPVAISYCLIGLSGLVGNLLVIFAILRVQRMRSITNLFLLCLSSADLLLVLVCIPVKGVAFLSYSWRFGEFMCKFVNYIQTVSMICSALTLTVMSIERFVAIRHPLKARSVCTIRHARLVIVSVWGVSFLLALPVIWAIEYRVVGIHQKAHWCHKYWQQKPTYARGFELYMLLVILIVPCTVMVVTYTWIANIIWTVATRRADMRSGSCISNTSTSNGDRPMAPSSGEVQMQQLTVPVTPYTRVAKSNKTAKAYMDDDRTRKQVVMMLIVVVIVFVICWTPILLNNVLVAFELLDYLHMGALKYVRQAFHLMSYANSCVNPFIYAFMSKSFREEFIHSVKACYKGGEYMRRKQMSGRSMTSTTRASTSQSGDKINGQRSDSIAMRRPSEYEETDNRKL